MSSVFPLVLDRLTSEKDRRRRMGMYPERAIAESVQRDLEKLLNTRWRCLNWPPSLDELDSSLVNYGIPDFTGIHFREHANQDRLARAIRDAIERFEPRLESAVVEVAQSGRADNRGLRFRIQARVTVDNSEEVLHYETTLDFRTAEFRVGRSQ